MHKVFSEFPNDTDNSNLNIDWLIYKHIGALHLGLFNCIYEEENLQSMGSEKCDVVELNIKT